LSWSGCGRGGVGVPTTVVIAVVLQSIIPTTRRRRRLLLLVRGRQNRELALVMGR
jgi:hypothetical protein